MSFAKILGHAKNIARLKALVASGRVPPALLFCGPEGTGKFLVAQEFAKALNCTHKPAEEKPAEENLFGAAPSAAPAAGAPMDDACDNCVSCLQIDSGAHPDVRVIDAEFQGFLRDEGTDKQQALRIDTVREFSRYVYQKTMLSPWKVFIINDAHTLRTEAQNAMLKILEEPPERTVFLLVAAKKSSLLATIISRSYALDFKELSAADVEELLERSGLPLDEAARLSELSGGSVKNAADIKRVRERLAAVPPGPDAPFRLAAALPRKEAYLARAEVKIMLDMLILAARKKWLAAGREQGAARFAVLIRKLLTFRKYLNQNVSHALVLEAALLESEKLSVSLR